MSDVGKSTLGGEDIWTVVVRKTRARRKSRRVRWPFRVGAFQVFAPLHTVGPASLLNFHPSNTQMAPVAALDDTHQVRFNVLW